MSSSTDAAQSIPDLRISPSQKEEGSSELVKSLIKLSKKSPNLVKAAGHDVKSPDGNETSPRTRRIWSWRMDEWKYSAHPSPFPTLARGLFTEWVPASTEKWSNGNDQVKGGNLDSDGFHRVVARGYDKFFNMNEVRWNTWDAVEAHTTAPYYLTLKSNGCIIFIAPLSPSEVVVMSKHSLGALDNRDVSHAQMGEKWLDRHLESKGRTKAQLAQRLWDENVTAVAELCDDSFEEHVLPYTEDFTGLHLHGINRNQGTFETFSPQDVQAFAKEWGFIPTPVITLQSTKEVKEFTDKIGKSGQWEGQAVEGFVVRTKIAQADQKSSHHHTVAPPYPPGSDYFFKIKFDEPYMTYRDWREITRTILTARKKKIDAPKIPQSKLRRPESFVYRDWVTKEINRNPAAFSGFTDGQGIIAVRENFLKWLETEEGKEALLQQGGPKKGSMFDTPPTTTSSSDAPQEKWERVVIVPVAVPGCGKTVVGLALTRLFGFEHTQSDDIQVKRTAATFERNIVELFRDKGQKVVFADRNNHLGQHRQGIRQATGKVKGPRIKLLALHWGFTLPIPTIARICGDRISSRGENHQSLRADDDKSHETVIWKFLEEAQELGSQEVDQIIEMNIEDTPEEAVNRVIDRIVPLLSLERPSNEAIKEACDEALKYQPTVRKDIKTIGPPTSARYFGLLAELDLEEVVSGALETALEDNIPVPEGMTALWKHLQEKKRVTRRPHITIIHINSLPQEQPLWDRCTALQKLPIAPVFDFRLSHLVADSKIMAITIEEVTTVEDGLPETVEAEGKKFLDDLPEEVRIRLHITVGTRDDSALAWMAGPLVEKWKGGASEDKVVSLPLKALKGQGRIKPLFH
ncbi:hypothetical protein FRB94_008228 [Tulasnella sp. JGI-2019a]|nr:hypothetical protein FRB93_005512 [Tulasnella sp. JGI-2019a]KAG8996528.1 hypothetical protein FRB94_008228 [Tulasnella sp. JGI-2019a]